MIHHNNRMLQPISGSSRCHTRSRRSDNRARNPSSSRPKIHITDKASPEATSGTSGSKSDGSPNGRSPEANGHSWTLGSSLAGNRPNPDDNRSKHLAAQLSRNTSSQYSSAWVTPLLQRPCHVLSLVCSFRRDAEGKRRISQHVTRSVLRAWS